MSGEPSRKVVEQFFEGISAGDFDKAYAVIAEDVYWWVAGGEYFPFSGVHTKADAVKTTAGIVSVFPDGLHLTPTNWVVQDADVSVEVDGHAVTVDGRNYDNKYHFFFRVRDGQIVVVKEYHDTLYATKILIEGLG